jgi:hypothetical protein
MLLIPGARNEAKPTIALPVDQRVGINGRDSDEPNNGHALRANPIRNSAGWHTGQRDGIGLTFNALRRPATNVNTAPNPRPI